MSTVPCVCGHIQYDHIYEEGACRPGFVCEARCTQFCADDGQLSIDDALADVIPSRTTDPATSHAAAREVKIKAKSQRAYLLWSFYINDANSGLGLTDEQAMRASEFVQITSEYAKRCSELREGGFIEATGETRAGSAGPQRIVSRITDKGRAWIQENRA